MLIAAGVLHGADDRLVVLGGKPIEGTITAIDPDGKIHFEDQSAGVALQDIRRIERPTEVKPPATVPVTVRLHGGGRLLGETVSTAEEMCQVKWLHGELELPLDSVRGIQFTPGESLKVPASVAGNFEQALSATSGEMDEFFVVDDQGGVQSLSGVLESITDGQVSFVWQDASRQIPIQRVYGIVVAALGDPPNRNGQCQVTFADSSSLWAKVNRLEMGELVLEPAKGSQVTVPWSSVARLTVRSERLAFLSDLDPVQASQEVIVAFPRTYQRDSSVGKSPLSVRGRTFEKGVGVQSRSELVYANEGFNLLAATIGIDDSARGHGDCEFVILADGKELLRERITGRDAPRDIQVAISGADQVTLLVEPGADLDLSDHADWCDARFIRAASPPDAARQE